jgi:hypothetical protein
VVGWRRTIGTACLATCVAGCSIAITRPPKKVVRGEPIRCQEDSVLPTIDYVSGAVVGASIVLTGLAIAGTACEGECETSRGEAAVAIGIGLLIASPWWLIAHSANSDMERCSELRLAARGLPRPREPAPPPRIVVTTPVRPPLPDVETDPETLRLAQQARGAAGNGDCKTVSELLATIERRDARYHAALRASPALGACR